MVSEEYIYSQVKAHHVVGVYMKGEKRIDNLSLVVYLYTTLFWKNTRKNNCY